MLPVAKRWLVAEKISPEVEEELQIYHPIVQQLLYNRSIKTYKDAQLYLDAALPDGTDPFLMTGMQRAVERLVRAVVNQEPIAIYGDYDADGVTATALLVQVLQGLKANVRGYIPNRFDEGYGLNTEALDYLTQEKVCVVITVDCGMRSPKEAAYASSLGIDLIITDHHHPDDDIPQAYAIINPKQPGDRYPEKELAGVGLAYKLADALVDYMLLKDLPTYGVDPDEHLDLVALGTVADLAPLVGENRTLVRRGLKLIRDCRRQGLSSLMAVAGLKPARVAAGDIGFIIGPRLNAAGRLESALAALDLLTTNSIVEAGRLAQQLDNQNRERQRITLEIQTRAEELAMAQSPDALLLFAAHPEFNPGVVGLAASRLTELYYRPSIVAHQGEAFTRASCRSISEFHITDALDLCADLLVRHGGHAAAAGFTVSNENLPALVSRLQAIAAEKLGVVDLSPTLRADMVIPLSELHPDLLGYLDLLQPTGHKNPQAYFISLNLNVVKYRTVGKDNSHLRLTISDGWLTYDAIAFRMGYWANQMPHKVDLFYTFELNEFNGRASLQLNVRDLRPAGISG